jgi:hypothetical protein
VVELVDTLDLKSNDPWVVRVQVPPSVLKRIIFKDCPLSFKA